MIGLTADELALLLWLVEQELQDQAPQDLYQVDLNELRSKLTDLWDAEIGKEE